MKFALLVGLVFAAGSAHAQSIKLSRSAKSEDVLRRFIEGDPSVKARFDDAAKREESFLAEARDSDLRDSVAEKSGPEEMKRQLAQASGARRVNLLERLPGMKAPSAPVCRSLGDCAVPELALDVMDASRLPDSVRQLIRPWMLLQQARGSSIVLTPASAGDAVLTLKLKGLDAAPLTLNVSPRLLGGFKVWFEQPLVLASLYGRERDAALKR